MFLFDFCDVDILTVTSFFLLVESTRLGETNLNEMFYIFQRKSSCFSVKLFYPT